MTTSAAAAPSSHRFWRVPRSEWAPSGIGLAVALLFAGAPSTVTAYAGLDPSWTLGLNLGRSEGFEFGRDMVFTYGPWGYLDHPAPVGTLHFLAALVYSVLVAAALYGGAYVAFRRRWEASPIVAAVAAAVLAAIAGAISEASTMALAAAGIFALIHVVAVAEGATRTGRVTALPVALAVAAGLLVQVKISVGVAVAIVAFLTALGDLAVKRLVVDALASGVAFVVSFLAWWLLAGQSLGWLPEWVRGSIEIVRGYPDAMGSERADRLVGYLVALALTVFVLVQWVRLGRRLGLRRAVVPLLVSAALAEFAFKAAFIRHDDHEFTFFTVTTAALVAIAPLARHRAAAIVAVAGAVLMIVPGTTWLDARQARDSWRVALQIALVPSSDDAYDDQAKAGGTASYQLPEEFVTAIGDQPVAVDPFEVALAYDYDMEFRPWPVMQAYSAYTPFLDRLNARAARTAPADQMVLRYPTATIDGRNSQWETPEYILTLACQYTQELTNGLWSLLRHDAESHCGKRRQLTQATLDADEAVTVPEVAPDELLVASFEPDGESILDKLSTAFFRDRTTLFVTADDADYRLPEALAVGPLLVAYPDRGDQGMFPAFKFGQMSFSEPGTVTFSSIPIDPVQP